MCKTKFRQRRLYALLYFFAGRYILHLFLESPTETALQTGVMFFQILSPFYFKAAKRLIL